MIRKILFVLVILAAVLGIVAATTQLPQPFDVDSVSAQRFEAGSFDVGSLDRSYVDKARKSQAYGSFAGSNERRLETTVWFPESDSGPFPLLIYSHGFMSRRGEAAYLGRYLASFGYVVVAADYPLTSRSVSPDKPYAFDVVYQPGDVSFLIDRLITEGNSGQSKLAGLVDDKRIGALGLSLGGLTTTLAAFHPEMADARIQAAMSIAGPTGLFNVQFFQHRNVPFLMLASTLDAIVPYPENGAPVSSKIPGSQLVTIDRGTHVGFAEIAKWFRWMQNPDSLACDMVLDTLDEDIETDWTPLFGTAEIGINMGYRDPLCQQESFPEALNPIRQMMITAVVVEAFFTSELHSDPDVRSRAKTYLQSQMASELSEVLYQGG